MKCSTTVDKTSIILSTEDREDKDLELATKQLAQSNKAILERILNMFSINYEELISKDKIKGYIISW